MSTPIVVGWVVGWMVMFIGIVAINEEISDRAMSFFLISGIVNAVIIGVLILIFGWHP